MDRTAQYVRYRTALCDAQGRTHGVLALSYRASRNSNNRIESESSSSSSIVEVFGFLELTFSVLREIQRSGCGTVRGRFVRCSAVQCGVGFAIVRCGTNKHPVQLF